MSGQIRQFPNQAAIKTISEGNSGRHVFRQKRSENAGGELQLTIGNKNYQLVNWSRTGVAFEMPTREGLFDVGLKVGPVRIHVGAIEVYHGDLFVRSCRDISPDARLIGAEFQGKLFLQDGIEAAFLVNRCVDQLNRNSDEMRDVNAEVCKIIIELGSDLRALKHYCQELEQKLENLTFDERIETLAIFLPNLTNEVKRIFNGYSRKLASTINVETIPEDSTYHRLFEEHVFPFFEEADLFRRAFHKPRGYAGDYEMMNAIYRNGFEGRSLLGKLLHHYAINEDQSETVQFRKPYFINHMESVLREPGSKSILSVACGPAVEIQEIVSRWTQDKLNRMQIVLFDLDRMALEHAQTKIYQVAFELQKSPQIEFVNASVKAFLKENAAGRDKFDLIYSGGLFDYIDNQTSKHLIAKFCDLLAPHGRLVIGNLTKANSTMAFCHLVTRWHLIHKTEDEMRAWTEDLKNVKVEFDYDPLRVQAFIVVTKQ